MARVFLSYSRRESIYFRENFLANAALPRQRIGLEYRRASANGLIRAERSASPPRPRRSTQGSLSAAARHSPQAGSAMTASI